MVMPTPVLPGSSCRAWPGLESGCAPAPRPCLCPRQPCAQPWPLSDSYPYLWEVPSDHPFLLIPGPGQQGEETLHSRFSGDRKVPSSACNLCGCLSSQQPLGTGQDCFWSQRTGQDGGGLCEWEPFPGASSLRVSTLSASSGDSPVSISRLTRSHSGTPVWVSSVLWPQIAYCMWLYGRLECKRTKSLRGREGRPLSQP